MHTGEASTPARTRQQGREHRTQWHEHWRWGHGRAAQQHQRKLLKLPTPSGFELVLAWASDQLSEGIGVTKCIRNAPPNKELRNVAQDQYRMNTRFMGMMAPDCTKSGRAAILDEATGKARPRAHLKGQCFSQCRACPSSGKASSVAFRCPNAEPGMALAHAARRKRRHTYSELGRLVIFGI